MISYEDFQRVEIRIGTIAAAERVPETDKLLKLTVDLGEAEPRQLVAGIAAIVDNPGDLLGKQVPVLANLAPRIIRGIESQGMILVADRDGTPVLLHPVEDVQSGSVVR